MERESTEDDWGLPDDVDAALSFEIDGYEGPNFLIGNSHTFPGRMAAYSAVDQQAYSVSLSEMTNMSPAARAWVSGFLAGSSPGPPESVGGEQGDPVEVAWRDALSEFRKSGELPPVSEAMKVAARDRICVVADSVVSQSDFAHFLRVLDKHLRESSGRWTLGAGEYFFDFWAAVLDSAGQLSYYGIDHSTAIDADWQQLTRSIIQAVFSE